VAESHKALIRDETFAAITGAAIVACQWWIMDELEVPADWAIPTLATAIGAAVLFLWVFPGQQKKTSRFLRLGLAWTLVVANTVNLIALGAQAFFDRDPGAIELLFTGGVLWTMNVLVFGLLYWVMDAGGPEVRAGDGQCEYDWVFPQQTDVDNAPKDWRPTFGDYLYLAFTGAIAFGPTDAMPYTRRAKMAMAIEGALALATLGVIIARAVSLAGA